MLRIRGVPITDRAATELLQYLAADESATELVARMRRALENEGGLIATDKGEASAVLFAVDRVLDRAPDERLLELRASLIAFTSVSQLAASALAAALQPSAASRL